jgi:hypothetical protein
MSIYGDIEFAGLLKRIASAKANGESLPGAFQAALEYVTDMHELQHDDYLNAIAKESGVEAQRVRKAFAHVKDQKTLGGHPIEAGDPEPWPDPIDGAGLFDAVYEFLRRYLAAPEAALVTIAGYIIASHAIQAFEVVGYLMLTSPLERAGKSRAVDLAELLARRPYLMVSPTSATLYRIMEAIEPTLLLDEAEVVRADGTSSGINNELIAILNAGYERGREAPRCAGDNHEVRGYGVFGFKILALIGRLPRTIEDRSIIIRMERRRKDQSIQRFFRHLVAEEAETLQRKAATWCARQIDALRQKSVELLNEADKDDAWEFLNDRQVQCWLPLLTVAHAAGEKWYARVMAAARELATEETRDTLYAAALKKSRDLYQEDTGQRFVSSAKIVSGLRIDGYQKMTGKGLADIMAEFGLRSKSFRDGKKVVRGYAVEDLRRAWERWLE